ncbi:non-specific lipid-transfer protein 1-like [Impatiens glandulifera]|uniref:non-specific lipid-transfer protein 1-like n=1 Tax=Impatiens glandulifera TaxID=253017 RepID=UPI001FB0F7F8|nr:non-specific lipid-transfer protein 1-like [Impatiens glandulifera]
MGRSSGIVCLMVMCMVLSAPHAQATITCGDVTGYISPCLAYAMNGGGCPANCLLEGVKGLNNAAATTSDRQATCECLKTLAGSTSFSHAAEIPDKCGVHIPYTISPSTDCTKVT